MENPASIHATGGMLASHLFQYLLVAHPDEKITQQVIQEKQTFADRYQAKATAFARPHITIAAFLAKEAMEATMIRWMQRIISAQPGFPVLLDHYGGFPAHTVYLNIQDHHPFKQLGGSLKVVDQYINGNDCPPMKLVSFPHLSLARKLPPDIYEKAMPEYTRKAFHASFGLRELVLLRRQHQFDACRQVSVFHLGITANRTFN